MDCGKNSKCAERWNPCRGCATLVTHAFTASRPWMAGHSSVPRHSCSSSLPRRYTACSDSSNDGHPSAFFTSKITAGGAPIGNNRDTSRVNTSVIGSEDIALCRLIGSRSAFGSLGRPELLVIFVIALIVFGPSDASETMFVTQPEPKTSAYYKLTVLTDPSASNWCCMENVAHRRPYPSGRSW